MVIFVAIFGLFTASIEVCYDLEDYCLNKDTCHRTHEDTWKSALYILSYCLLLSGLAFTGKTLALRFFGSRAAGYVVPMASNKVMAEGVMTDRQDDVPPNDPEAFDRKFVQMSETPPNFMKT